MRRPGVAGGRALAPLGSAVVVLATLYLTVGLPLSNAAFVSTTANGVNSFAAASCFYSPNIQSGTTVNSADGIQVVSISAVDPTTSFVMFTSRHDSNRPVGSVIGGHLASATTLEFHRATDEVSPAPITIEWSVVDYTCGLSVQRGITEIAGVTVDQAITPVAATDAAFVTYSKVVASTDNTWSGNDHTAARLTSTGNLRFTSNLGGSPSHYAHWQVVEFTDPSMISVQSGTTSIPAGSFSTDVALSAVDTAKTFVLISTRGDVVDVGSSMVRPELTSGTNLHLERINFSGDVTEIAWQAIELNDGSSVQHGVTLLGPGQSAATEAIGTVDLSRATAFTGAQNGSGQNGGRTPYTADDNPGVASITLSFNSATEVAITRSNTADFGSFAWQVVSWGRP